jgi:transposase
MSAGMVAGLLLCDAAEVPPEPQSRSRPRRLRRTSNSPNGRLASHSAERERVIREAANAAIRSKNTYLRGQYEQVKRRRGHKKAIVAVAHSILIAAHHILKDDVPYHDLGGDYFARRADPERITKRLIAQLEQLGHTVTLQTATAEGPVAV